MATKMAVTWDSCNCTRPCVGVNYSNPQCIRYLYNKVFDIVSVRWCVRGPYGRISLVKIIPSTSLDGTSCYYLMARYRYMAVGS